MKSIFLKGVGSILFCAVVNAIILGTSSEAFLPESSFRPFWGARGSAILTAFIFIVFMGWWLFYIPFLAVFYTVIKKIKKKSLFINITVGAFLGGACSALAIFLFLADQTQVAWYSFPTIKEWFTVPEYAVVGAMYGLVYSTLPSIKPNYSAFARPRL